MKKNVHWLFYMCQSLRSDSLFPVSIQSFKFFIDISLFQASRLPSRRVLHSVECPIKRKRLTILRSVSNVMGMERSWWFARKVAQHPLFNFHSIIFYIVNLYFSSFCLKSKIHLSCKVSDDLWPGAGTLFKTRLELTMRGDSARTESHKGGAYCKIF